MADFPPGEWGTYGQWASAFGTTAAFTATFYVIRRDARVRQVSQARKVTFYTEREEPEKRDVKLWEAMPKKPRHTFFATVKNLSDEPIYDVGIYVCRRGKKVDILASDDVLLPTSTLKRDSMGWFYGSLDARFRDNSGRTWDRTWDGKLRERGKFRLLLEKHFRVGWTTVSSNELPAYADDRQAEKAEAKDATPSSS